MVNIVKVLQVGRLGYGQSLKLQELLARKHFDSFSEGKADNMIHDSLLLVEHNPVYTIGIRSKDYDQDLINKLRNVGAEFFQTNRGGLITFHGPGQLVAYPIINLKHFNPSVRWYVSCIEETVIRLCRTLGIEAGTSPDTGVWIGNRKICAIGIHGKRFVTTHGLALNCNTDLEWFSHIVPCGLEGKEVTSLSAELRRDFSVEEAIPLFLKSFSETFRCNLCSYPTEEANRLLMSLNSQT